jgi:hypothetical protein
MELVFEPSERCRLRIWSGPKDGPIPQWCPWYAEVTADITVKCGHGKSHDLHVHREREIKELEEDDATLRAYEWCIRGNTAAAIHMAAMLVDEEMHDSFVDPCIIPTET